MDNQYEEMWDKFDKECEQARKEGRDCEYCGKPAIGTEVGSNTRICQTCSDGISPLDPYGIKSPYNPVEINRYDAGFVMEQEDNAGSGYWLPSDFD